MELIINKIKYFLGFKKPECNHELKHPDTCLQNKIEEAAVICFGKTCRKFPEVFFWDNFSVLTIRLYRRSILSPLFSLITVKRFYELCNNQNLLYFSGGWESTSLSFENGFIEINFYIINK